ncbi:nitroreductase family protein [Desulfuromonas acetoxidans]|uniref:Nitroreductase n=1 Tax=Desulfuromonas acetoxidans (strain DSM 684 / 11070) TaxID=281689 RepID=Q1K449_DESA6|nr:nitroreductase family protein [Desulfuromonas acetoxidans]EAT17254.1 nitroreductase [Desulfuromonas acetoxidans DSM 684]MBF0645902.1 nitroreductase family protein [Desulfuromonas acetoxidans]NVD24156.1 nitroreductase family protein [Desulfuromonas acetoxidans]NVE15071.1 nitroreductase family protein [Desulfuromonas acetoxidans]
MSEINATLETIVRRHSIRKFTDQPVSEEMLQAVLHAANQAPSAHNQQSWRFVVVTGEKKRQLAELVKQRATDFPKASSALLRMAARSIATAPVVVAVANTGELIEHGTKLFQLEDAYVSQDFFRTMEIQSSAAAVENMLLAATALGFGSVWLGVLFLIKDEVMAFLGEGQGEFMAVVPIGYAERDSSGPKKRATDVVVRRLD